MSWWKNLATFGLAGLLKGDKKKKEATLSDQLAPFLKQFSDIAGKYSGQAEVDYGKAGLGYDEAMKYYQNILHGDRDTLLENLDATGLNKAVDEQERQNYELAPRGGRRAATSANLGFDKLANLNSFLQNLRSQAPGQVANISQALSNMAQGKLSAAIGGTSGASNLLFGIEGVKQQEADRKAQFLGSIFEAIGSVAGALACNTLDTWILTPKGYKLLKDIHVSDKVMYVASMDGQILEGKVIRKDIKKEQDIFELTCNGSFIKGTSSHILRDISGVEVSFEDLGIKSVKLPYFINDEIKIVNITKFKALEAKADVAILKLNSEIENYNYITNGFISVDADCLKG